MDRCSESDPEWESPDQKSVFLRDYQQASSFGAKFSLFVLSSSAAICFVIRYYLVFVGQITSFLVIVIVN